MSRPAIPSLHRKNTGLVSNTQSTPTPTSTRSAQRGLGPALPAASVAPLRPIKRRGSLKETAQKVQASVSKTLGTFKPFPMGNAVDVGGGRSPQGTTRVVDGVEPRAHKRDGSDGSSIRTVTLAREQAKRIQATPTALSITPPATGDTLRSPGISVHPSNQAPRCLSPVFSESILSDSIISDAPLISAFDVDGLESVLSEALSADARWASSVLKNAGLWLSNVATQNPVEDFEEQSEPLLRVDEMSYIEERRARTRTSSTPPIPTKARLKREKSIVSTTSSSVEYYTLGATEMFKSKNSVVKGELELVRVKERMGSKVSSAAPLSAVPPHVKPRRRPKYGDELTPDDSASQFSSSTATSSQSRASSASGVPSTRTSTRHRRAVGEPVKADKGEIASFKEARRQLEYEAASAASTISTASTVSYRTAHSSASSRSRSLSVASSRTITTSTGSVRTPHAKEFPAVPVGDAQHVYKTTMEHLQQVAILNNIDLDVESVYRQRFQVALNVHLQQASTQALAETFNAVGDALGAVTVPRRHAQGAGKVY
ncbi:unnamed protein product [Peniophora sp. CBMAI 1063]|nr:unnamed protein product [Peniophora sp. CBMAI 1063]